MSAKTEKTKKSHITMGVIMVLLSFMITTASAAFFLLHRDTVYNGVVIENIDVGGFSITETQNKLQKHFDSSLTQGSIQLIYGDKAWNMTGQDIGYTFDYTKAVHEAYSIGREGNYFERLQKILSLYKEPHYISLIPIYDASKLDNFLEQIKQEVDQPARNATIIRRNNVFEITDEKVGLKLNKAKTRELMDEEVKHLKYNSTFKIQLPVEQESPQITSEILSHIQDVLGIYSTKFNAGNKPRTQNIAVATRALNGTVLMPNEVFSFNEVVGPRTREKGYQDAPVIFNGEMAEGIGGGVCQVSSTIYNAALISNLKVIERVKHSIPSTYVPKGQDATVSYGVLDFKFQNPYPFPIYIEGYTSGDQMTIKIYGQKIDNKVIRIHSVENEVVKREVEIKYDNQMLQGQERIEQEGRDGYKATTYKIIYENGVEISREQVSKDYYRPQKQIIVKGTKKPPVTEKKKEEGKKETEQIQGPEQIGEASEIQE